MGEWQEEWQCEKQGGRVGWRAGEEVVGNGVGGESGCGSWQREPVYRWGVEGGCREAEEEGVWGTGTE